MVMKRSALGRGLDALITMDDLKTGGSSSISEIELSKIQPNPDQPRSVFEEETLEELAVSIRSLGVIQPITLKETGTDKYMIISGERRYRASLMAGLERIPAYIKTAADENVVEMALIENIQREDLNAIEEAAALARLQQEFGLTHEQIADAVGKSRTTVTNIMRLLGLQPEVRGHMEARRLEMGHGRALLALPQHQQIAAAREIVEKGLSVRATEALVRRLLNPPEPQAKPAEPSADIRRLERELSETIGAKLAIEHRKGGKGRLVIDYSSLEQLDGILGFFRAG